MKKTAFDEIHKSLNAKMVEFAGYSMPIQYEGIIAEHKKVRTAVGVFDVSHMGEFEVRGRDAFDFVQRMTSNDVTQLAEGRVQYSTMLYDNGGIVDDLLVYHCGDYVQLVVNAANLEKDWQWLQEHVEDDVELIDRSDETSLLAVQGPSAPDVMRKVSSVVLEDLPYYHFTRGSIAGVECLISRTGYTGEIGYEIYFDADTEKGMSVWNALFEAGSEYGIAPIGLGARDTLRLEVGFCLYGNDIDHTTTPLEANLGWITKLNKGEFIGRDVLVLQKEQGLSRKLVGLVIEGKSIPRHGYEIRTGDGVGNVTSGNISPMLEKGIALGYVPIQFATPGSSVEVFIRKQPVPATVTKVPFVSKQ